MLLARVLTVVVILPLFLAALFWLPQRWWGGFTLVIIAVGCAEWSRLIALSPVGRVTFGAVTVSACAVLGLTDSDVVGILLLGAALMFWIGAVPIWLRGGSAPSQGVLAAAGILILCSAWYALFDLQQSAPRLLILMCVVWIADTGAYVVGRSCGRHRIAPRISPGKTWEGVAGGVIGVSLYYGVLWWVWSPRFLVDTRLLDLAIVAGMTMLSIEGDLFESWIKRRAGVKDSGTILPGHGGVLDRIDGVVAALPVAALLGRMH